MKYFSMFSGIGGFELGIQRAFESRQQEPIRQGSIGQHIQRQRDISNGDVWRGQPQSQEGHRILNGVCIGYSEIDKYAIKVYERQFNGDNRPNLRNGSEKIQNNSSDTQERKDRTTSGHYNYGDATKIVAAELPDFDLLVGGFPCQAFSIAGKRAGFNDTRGTLFFDIARILKEKQPRHLVLENVKGLLSHDSGRTFTTIIGVLTDLGYSVEWQVLNSKNFGVPQNRERIYFVGHLGNECGRQVFPIIRSSQQIASVAGYISEEVWPRRHEQIRRVYNDDGAMPTIPTGQGGGVMTKFIAAQRGRENGQVLEPQVEDKSNTLTAVAKDNYVVDVPRIRRLTPLECERLQGFPDDWTAGESDTQRYKMCGNAVTVNTVQAVMEGLMKCL